MNAWKKGSGKTGRVNGRIYKPILTLAAFLGYVSVLHYRKLKMSRKRFCMILCRMETAGLLVRRVDGKAGNCGRHAIFVPAVLLGKAAHATDNPTS